MAKYKYPTAVNQVNGNAFDFTYAPGDTVPHSGIYRCQGCGLEDANNKGDPFPPQNHHQHPDRRTPIAWRLVVATQQSA
ncbi:hypothetical protein [Phenylobacterium sp.]|uniref:hypothetical protein n=1 Tax=Phenylobacterium sp. TaxID=1871053 RepID=UPI0035ADAF1E